MINHVDLQLKKRIPDLWVNSDYGRRTEQFWPTEKEAKAAEKRLLDFAPLLATLFHELKPDGIIESLLIDATALQPSFLQKNNTGKLWIKGDHGLPVAGSIKARGGFHEVLEFTEKLALRHGLITHDSDRTVLNSAPAKKVFAQYEVVVGSTGNLGMSIGLIASALGFKATVHMSSDAKEWKKERLRQHGVNVVEHEGDYALAVAAGRLQAQADPFKYFVDDEHSSSLFYGYSVAAFRLKKQFDAAGIVIDHTHPLFVYLPCGVGGAPAGITFGLKSVYGNAVHCFFIEPKASACFYAQMAYPEKKGISVYDLGMNNVTEADGLAVPVASALAIDAMRPLLSGVITIEDQALFSNLYAVKNNMDIKLEPSAAAGFSGPDILLNSVEGQSYLSQHGLNTVMGEAHHLIWTTGGLLVPDAEYKAFYERGAHQ